MCACTQELEYLDSDDVQVQGLEGEEDDLEDAGGSGGEEGDSDGEVRGCGC